MKANIYIENEIIGTTNFRIADESMGGIIGDFLPNENYEKYRNEIQSLTESKGIANVSDFNFKLELKDYQILNPQGGIGITDLKDFDEIIIESVGNEQEIIERIKKEASS